jgi:hypothetical protein
MARLSAAAWMRFERLQPLQAAPQWVRYVKIMAMLRFFGMLVIYDLFAWIDVWRLQFPANTSTFSTLNSVYG